MASLRRHEGLMVRDDRVSGGAFIECPTYTCHHCQNVVIMNPLRTRSREYCPKCDHFICDGCGLKRKLDGGDCLPLKKVMDELGNAAAKGLTVIG